LEGHLNLNGLIDMVDQEGVASRALNGNSKIFRLQFLKSEIAADSEFIGGRVWTRPPSGVNLRLRPAIDRARHGRHCCRWCRKDHQAHFSSVTSQTGILSRVAGRASAH